MGQIRQRGTVWWIRYYRNGKRHEESAHTSKYDEAKRLLKSREGDVAKGLPITAALGRHGPRARVRAEWPSIA